MARSTTLSTGDTALDAVIDEIIVEVPVTATTLYLRSLKFDKAPAVEPTDLVRIA